ncbi:hypothetical protein KBX50_05145 [Micromonospora sp. C51]|uniref:hypothetical protein n=1 Tax=Micromonospora sp. C51 TaxID=2824879 RepID=UPI001B37BC64|nr:hypothetical protein [Micromonospora sp. C51]MBQ1047844.1 hypothetical protein [Micromonospora sp. C51]
MTERTDERDNQPEVEAGSTTILTPGVEENPDEVTGGPADEDEVLGEAAYLADPAEHQGGDA